MQTCIELLKCLSGTIYRVYVWDKVSSVNYLSCNIWGCVYSTYPFILWSCESLCTYNLIIIIKVETWTICLCLGFGHETMVCAVCLSMVLPDIAYLKRKIKMMLIVIPARICWSNARLLAWPTPIEIYTPWHEDPRTVPNWRCDWANHVLCVDLIGTSACLQVVAGIYLKQDTAFFS